jgi:hypothetical protein
LIVTVKDILGDEAVTATGIIILILLALSRLVTTWVSEKCKRMKIETMRLEHNHEIITAMKHEA